MSPYSYTGSVQTASVGTAGVYDIVGYGGRGGKSSQYGTAGGYGAEEGGDFALSAGEKLRIVVGGQGGDSDYGGGGGATFVLGSTDGGASYTLLVAAGGGGGAYLMGGHAGYSTAARPKGNGSGGTSYSSDGGGGGAGFKGAGASDGGGGGSVGPSYAGGAGTSGGGPGGFGGGGGGGNSGGGGGGGYTGGAGRSGTPGFGLGGTSYLGTLADNTDTVATDGENAGNGFVTIDAVCFVSGTLIRTARGDVTVEALRVGDLAVTSGGACRPITWIGHRTLRHRTLGHGTLDHGTLGQSTLGCRSGAPQANPEPMNTVFTERDAASSRAVRPPRGFRVLVEGQPRNDGAGVPHDAWPVRILAGAFGGDLPERDLWLSPGHPVLVGSGANEHLVPIMCLVNGTSIARQPVENVTYWHIELDVHDILLAEGLPAESFLDCGNRPWFGPDAEAHAFANPDFVIPGLGTRCRPVAFDGPLVEAERRRLDRLFAMRLSAQCAWSASGDVAVRA